MDIWMKDEHLELSMFSQYFQCSRKLIYQKYIKYTQKQKYKMLH